jgi:hypothetical protein
MWASILSRNARDRNAPHAATGFALARARVLVQAGALV